MATSYRGHTHLMGLTFASTRLSAAALFGLLAFPMGRLFKGGVYLKIILFCKITDIKYSMLPSSLTLQFNIAITFLC